MSPLIWKLYLCRKNRLQIVQLQCNLNDKFKFEEEQEMNDTVKRAFITVAVFVIIYFLAWVFSVSHDMRFFAAVIGAGCYWIGSNKR